MKMALCGICQQNIESDRGNIQSEGLKNLIDISNELCDGAAARLLQLPLPIPIHKTCRRNYTKPSIIASKKRKREESDDKDNEASRQVRRSEISHYNPYTDCFYCTETITFFRNCTKSNPENYDKKVRLEHRDGHNIATKEIVKSTLTKAEERNDEWGNAVKYRLTPFLEHGDLVAEEAKYHHECQVRFNTGQQRTTFHTVKKVGRPTGKVDSVKDTAFVQLIDYLNTDDKCDGQYTCSELMTLMNSFIGDEQQGYSSKWLTKKLLDHYGGDLIVTSQSGRETIFTLLDAGNHILRQNHKDSGMSKNDIIDMAAVLINDDIRAHVYDCTKYPKFSEMDNKEIVPESLYRLISGIVKRKAAVKKTKCVERKRVAIAHSIVAAVRPRSFLSPILLGVSTYINSKFESRELVDVLSSLSFADDYREVTRLQDSLMPANDSEFQVSAGDILNFVFDNADINIRTLTGLDTWHTMGGIVAQTPGDFDHGDVTGRNILRSTEERTAVQLGQFSQIPIQHYKKKKDAGVKLEVFGALESPKAEPQLLKLAKLQDKMGLMSFPLLQPLGVKCPNWSGFMQVAVTDGTFTMSSCQILPFINLDPTKPDSIYSALCFAQDQVSKQYQMLNGNQKLLASVTFDQPLYAKADDIHTANAKDLDRLFLRLGGFHLLMSYLGGVGSIMRGSGIQDLLATVYASHTVEHMINGHAYARALRGHFLISAALTKLMIDTCPGCLTGVSVERLRDIHAHLLQGTCTGEALLNTRTAIQFSQILDDLAEDLASQGRTGKLWINYYRQIQIVRLFLYAERTGDWDLHLYCVAQMVPIFHTSGHLAYARSERRYLDSMKKLPEVMQTEQFLRFTEEGYFTIRRSHRFWSGNFTDQTIEQLLMRQLKAPGGLAHGRGLTDSTQAKFVHVIPRCVPICNEVEKFCGVHACSSEQHTDLRATTTARDSMHFTTLYNWLRNHNPFSYCSVNGLVCISSGVVAESSANADNAYNIGKETADKLTGLKYGDVKLKRTDKVTSISAASNAVTVRGKEVHVNSNLLLMRTTCTIRKKEDMAGHLCYEFARKPPSLFDKGLMRKSTKSVLAKQLTDEVDPVTELPKNAHYVIDGGYLLHKVVWPKEGTYGDVCNEYVTYTKRHYGQQVTCIFDGYDNLNSTKCYEQERRVGGNVAPTIVFTTDTSLSRCSQKDFLNNRHNKSKFIKMLLTRFLEEGIASFQSQGDADCLIATTALTSANHNNQPVVLVGTDTDLLVQLVAKTRQDQQIYMQFDIERLYRICDIQEKLNPNMKCHILVAHAITGCDTVSALYNKGKKKIVSILSKSSADLSFLDAFQKNGVSCDEIAETGEKLLLLLYGAKTNVSTLNEQRYVMYCQQLVQKRLTSPEGFQLQVLPPTSDAAKYHSYRTYLQVQQWLGNETIVPTDWGWCLSDGKLKPVEMDAEVAPACVLRLISCGCKTGCHTKCTCRNNGLKCSSLCSRCGGNNCSNCEIDSDEL